MVFFLLLLLFRIVCFTAYTTLLGIVSTRAPGTRPVCTFHQDSRRLAHTEKTYDLTHTRTHDTYSTNIHLFCPTRLIVSAAIVRRRENSIQMIFHRRAHVPAPPSVTRRDNLAPQCSGRNACETAVTDKRRIIILRPWMGGVYEIRDLP